MISGKPARGVDKVMVTFAVPENTQDGQVAVVGDFNDWDPEATPLPKQSSQRVAALTVVSGRRYAFRYLGENGRWFTTTTPTPTRATTSAGRTPSSISAGLAEGPRRLGGGSDAAFGDPSPAPPVGRGRVPLTAVGAGWRRSIGRARRGRIHDAGQGRSADSTIARSGFPRVTLSSDRHGARACLSVVGDLDASAALAFSALVQTLVDEGARSIVVDLGAAEVVDAAGLQALVGAFEHLEQCKGEMVLRSPRSRTLQALNRAGLSDVLPIC